jgi:hypothetical protein
VFAWVISPARPSSMSWIENVRPPPPYRCSISLTRCCSLTHRCSRGLGLAQLHRLDAPLGDRTGNQNPVGRICDQKVRSVERFSGDLQTPVDLRLRLARVFLGALLGALALYLDFRNLFMMLFQWFGQRRQD